MCPIHILIRFRKYIIVLQSKPVGNNVDMDQGEGDVETSKKMNFAQASHI